MSAAARRFEALRPYLLGRPSRRRRAETTSHPMPVLSRDGMAWRTIGTDVVFTINVANDSERPTQPTHLVVEAAHFGAFVPGVRVARIAVGVVASGERRNLVFKVARTALPSPWEMAKAILGLRRQPPSDRDIDLVTSAEWAGNINVWFDAAPEAAVEVHRTLDVKVTAGRSVAVGLFLPPHHAGFNVALSTIGQGWRTKVVRVFPKVSVLIVKAPGAGGRAIVNLLVTRRSDSRTVPVDFTFQTTDGRSDRLGCICVSQEGGW